MPRIAELCEQIIARLSSIGSPIGKFLQPGLSEKAIRDLEDTLPFMFPDALVEMYKWHNGTELVAGTTFFPWWVFDTIAESISRYNVLVAPKDHVWKDECFPFFSSSDISSIGISCDGTAREDGEILWFEVSADTSIAFVSLEAMLTTILEAYEAKAIFMSSDGELEQDDDAFKGIARRLNPGIKRRAQ